MSKKRYKVIGSEPVLDNRQPGETFEASLPEDQEASLKQIGALQVVGRVPKDVSKAVKKTAERLAEEQEAAKRTPTD